MSPAEVQKSLVSGVSEENSEYTEKDLFREFPILFTSKGKVRRSPLKRKYTLRDALRKMEQVTECRRFFAEKPEHKAEIYLYTASGETKITGKAARKLLEMDVFVDMIEASWSFLMC